MRVETKLKVVQLVARPDTTMVMGVVGKRNGSRVFVKARRAVVLTTGSFSANKDMLEHLSPAVPITSAVSTGP